MGGLETLAVFGTELNLSGGIWSFLNTVIIGIFVVSWGVAIVIYRYTRYEELGLGPAPPVAADPGGTPGSAAPEP